MKQPLISIIIPVYNVEKYLEQCLESIVNQTYTSIEIILINDQSSDDSLSIIENYALLDKRIKFLTQNNTGLSGARNRGVGLCTGDYLMFVDSDDWLDLETCAVLVSKLNEDDYDVLFWSYVREYSNASLVKNIFEEETYFDAVASENLHRRIFGLTGVELARPEHADSVVTACMKLYKTSIIKHNNLLFVDTKIIGTEDALFNCYYFKFVQKAYYLHRHFYHYRRDNFNSLTSVNKPFLHAQWNKLFSEMKNVINEFHLNSSFSTALNNRIALSLIGLGINEMNASSNYFEKIRNIKVILKSPLHKHAITQLTLKYFPIHWKIFFYFAKINFTTGVFLLLFGINYVINRKK